MRKVMNMLMVDLEWETSRSVEEYDRLADRIWFRMVDDSKRSDTRWI